MAGSRKCAQPASVAQSSSANSPPRAILRDPFMVIHARDFVPDHPDMET
jgi:hypothetical protein